MLEGPGLAVSLPARELLDAAPPASLFRLEDLAEGRISHDLHTAIGLVDEACRRRNLPIVFVARPEMFTNAASLAWVQDRLGGIRDHLCISDGMAVRVIPQMRNHMFLYRLGIQANADGFTRLRRRAPELLSTMGGQVNTAFGVKLGSRRVDPPTVVLPAHDAPLPRRPRPAPELYRFFLSRHSPLRSAERSLAAGAAEGFAPGDAARIVYVPLTEVAARDAMFAEIVGGLLTRAAFDPSLRVILRMPFLAAPAATPADRIAAGLAGLSVARAAIPRVMSESVLFSLDDLDMAALGGGAAAIDLLAHESFDFWRHPPAFYAACASVTVHVPQPRRRERAAIRALLGGLLGREPTLRWLPAAARR